MSATYLKLADIPVEDWIRMGNFGVGVYGRENPGESERPLLWEGWAAGWSIQPDRSLIVQARYLLDDVHAVAPIVFQAADGHYGHVESQSIVFDLEGMLKAQADAEQAAADEEARSKLAIPGNGAGPNRQQRRAVPPR